MKTIYLSLLLIPMHVFAKPSPTGTSTAKASPMSRKTAVASDAFAKQMDAFELAFNFKTTEDNPSQ